MENFVIFKNEYKEKENQPDYRVRTKDGEEYVDWGACWAKQGSKGQYLSCTKSKPMDKKPHEQSLEEKQANHPKGEDEGIDPNDIPF